ncbi:MAG: DUF1232 domain-containing protein [Archangium sp.]|nr:DUF1232 domain-containing protein [Archangium sp.]
MGLRHLSPRWRTWVGLATLLYVVLPVDLVPDVVPVLGMLDDAAAVATALGLVLRTAKEKRAAIAS